MSYRQTSKANKHRSFACCTFVFVVIFFPIDHISHIVWRGHPCSWKLLLSGLFRDQCHNPERSLFTMNHHMTFQIALEVANWLQIKDLVWPGRVFPLPFVRGYVMLGSNWVLENLLQWYCTLQNNCALFEFKGFSYQSCLTQICFHTVCLKNICQ